MKCLMCESTRLVTDVKVVDNDRSGNKLDMKLEVQGKPGALLFKDPKEAVVRASVCAECGFVMLHMSGEDARALEEHQLKRR